MKKWIILLLILVIYIVTACRSIVIPQTTSSVGPTVQSNPVLPSYETGSSGSSTRMEVNEKNVLSLIRANISSSYFVMEGTVISKETLQPGQYALRNNSNVWDMYTFGNIEMITGCYEGTSLLLQVPHDDHYGPWHDYVIGQRYLCIIFSLDSVTYPYDEILYQGMGTVCMLSSEDPNRIEQLVVDGFQTDCIQTKQEFVSLVEKVIGITDKHYHPNDMYVHSDKISDIVQGATIVVRIFVEEVNSYSSVLDHCKCKVLHAYKGEIKEAEEQFFELNIRPRSAISGEEYIAMIQETYISPHYIVAAKKNAIIPITDTDRVQQVYDALGIQPEP